jgi:hypothetical protein
MVTQMKNMLWKCINMKKIVFVISTVGLLGLMLETMVVGMSFKNVVSTALIIQ